jgi:RNase P/RNase MRP subunit p29
VRAPPLAATLAIACWLGLTPALGATFVLDDGSTIAGTIVQATRNTVTIRPNVGGLRQVPIGRLEQVEVTTADGQKLLGRYRGWIDGRSLIAVGGEMLSLENDRVVERRPLTTPAFAAASTPDAPDAAVPVARAAAPGSPDPVAESGGPAAGASSDSAAGPRRAASAVVGPMPPHPDPRTWAAPAPAAGAAMAALPAGDLPVVSVTTSPEEITGASGAITFTVELSRPLDDLLVVIYSTVDGTARAGTDYQPLHGILTLPAGVTSATIQTTLVDHPEAGGKDFQLFLASNPDLVTIAEPWTKISIRDDE